MFTVCSKCNLRLTVTATDLRAAQGYVRCGRCHNVFNALAALADDPARLAEQAPPTDTQSRQALTLPEPPAAQSAAQPGGAEPLASTDTSLEFNPASTNINEVFIEASANEGTGTYESIILSVEDPALAAAMAADAEPEPEELIAPQAPAAPAAPAAADEPVAREVPPTPVPAAAPRAAVAARPVPAAPVPAAAVPAAPAPAPAAVAPAAVAPAAVPVAPPLADEEEIEFSADWSAPTPSAAPAEIAIPAAPATDVTREFAIELTAAVTAAEHPAEPESLLAPRGVAPRLPRWVLPAAAGILTLCLAAQALHHYRAPLAESALLHRPITALYQSLGQPLAARWDIARYEIRQLGATTDGAPAGGLVVRASISNHATRVQPLPLLRVVMQDRFGNRVAARDLKPAEYLGRGAPQVSLMAPGQRVDVQVAFQDPGQAATGFEIDACMAGQAHAVICANDPAVR